jgi:hypothetical protein
LKPEANLNTAFNEDRREALTPEPAVKTLFEAARELGSREVHWLDMDWAETPVWLNQELRGAAASAGIGLDIREGYRVLSRTELPRGLDRPKKRLLSPTALPRDTLVLRRNNYQVGPDFAVGNKDPFVRGVGAVLEASPGGNVHVPKMTSDPEEVLSPLREGLPNLVYKYPSYAKGTGVFFLRVRDPDQALAITRDLDERMGESPGLFQRFICSRLLPGNRIYDIRCELFITPLGARHVFSIRREATRPLPPTVVEGLLDGGGVFTSNLATGGRFAPLAPEEVEEIETAALAVGNALIETLNTTFETLR